MKINLNPDETVTILDSSGSQIIALSSYSALQQEAKRLGINPDGAGSLAGLGQAVLNAGGNPGLIVTWSGRQVSMTYKGPQNFERFDVWLDGASIDSAFLLSHTTTLPLLPAGTYQVKIAASWAGAVAVDPGVRLSFTYTSDGVGYTQTHPSQVPTRSGAALQDLGGYIRSVFAVYSLTVQTDPAIQTAYRSGAFTHIEEGMFDFVNYPDQASAQAQFNARWARVSSVCSTYGLKILALGDDLCRGNGTSNPAIANALSAWRPAVISAACATMQASGFLTGVLMVDEADFFAAAASDAQLDQLMATMRANAPNLKLTWPVHSSGSVRFTSRSDWFDLYWTTQENRFAQGLTRTTVASSLAQIRSDIQGAVTAPTDNTKPFSILNGVMGTNYSSGVPGTPPELVTAQIFLGWCFGAIGTRSYTFDYGSLPENQIGATPASVGTDRWAAMQAAYTLLAQLEQRHGFGTNMVQDAAFDPDVVKTTRGGVTVAINCSLGLRPLPGMPAPSYRLLGSVPQTSAWTGSLKPSEVAVWV